MTKQDKDYSISLEFKPDPKEAAFVFENLSRDAEIEAGLKKEYCKFGLFVRDNEGTIIGGLIAEIAWNWLYIVYIWIHEDIRGRGIGTRLLEEAENEAKRRGCRSAFLETFSFQARPLYEQLGYEVYGVLDDMPPGYKRFYMKKSLDI